FLSLSMARQQSYRTPTSHIRSGCCVRAARGHAAAPPSSVMNWRRLRSSMGSSPEPAVPPYPSLRMPRMHPLVLGADLNCSESKGWAACPLDMYLYPRPGSQPGGTFVCANISSEPEGEALLTNACQPAIAVWQGRHRPD